MLIDDEKKSVIEPLYTNRDRLKKLYSFNLNMGGGRLEGFLIEDTASVIKAIDKLTSARAVKKKYGSADPFVFAVGDGNHSIATAKACWDEIKQNLSEEERKTHPARYCLAEINNIYDDDLIFEPIYRVVFGRGDELIKSLQTSLSGLEELKLYYRGREYFVHVSDNSAQAIKDVQAVIDDFIANNKGVKQDYVHGDKHLVSVADKFGGVAVFMPKLKKEDLFKYVAKNSTLTRKSFSMGEAEEKRYYYECRKIR